MRRAASGICAAFAAGLAASAALAGLAASGCESPGNGLCDPGQILDPKSGYCLAAPADASGEGGADAPLAEGPTGDASCTPPMSMFGDTCSSNGDCHCPTDYCAIMPGSMTGTCTRTGCDVDPSICPSSWTCLDLSAFQAGLPHICYK